MNTRKLSVDAARLRGEFVVPAGPYAAVDVVASTGSTNADLRAAVADEAPDRTVLLAEEQTAGVGRRGRTWQSPAGLGLYYSVLLRPVHVPFARLGSLAVVAGLAVVDTLEALDVPVRLKWPNDVLAGAEGAKCAGVLAEAAPAEENAVVLGIGLNVLANRDHVAAGPGGLAPTSLAAQGANTTDRTEIATLLLRALARREHDWRAAGGDLAAAGLLADYRDYCGTIGRQVRVIMPDSNTINGRVVDVDGSGQLILDVNNERRTVFAGDVVHLRLDEGD